MFGYRLHPSDKEGNRSSEYGLPNNRQMRRNSGVCNYGYDSRNCQEAGYSHGRQSVEDYRRHRDTSGARRVPESQPSYSVNIAGWHSTGNFGERPMSCESRNQSDQVNQRNQRKIRPFGTINDVNDDDDDEDDNDSMLEGNNEKAFYCEVCDHCCSNLDTYINHINSLKHVQKVIEVDESNTSVVDAAEMMSSSTPISRTMLCSTLNNGNMSRGTEVTSNVPGGKPTSSTIPDLPVRPSCSSDYYCEVCCCSMSGPRSFDCHIDGMRHKKNLKHRAEGRLIKKGRSNKSNLLLHESTKLTTGQAQMMSLIDNIKQPLIGLQFVTEYQKSDGNVEPYYICTMCDSTCDPRTLIHHLTGFKHRMNYMKEHYTSYYTIVKQKYQKKPDQIPLAEEYARTIECEEGRQQVKVIVEARNCTEDYIKPCTDDIPATTVQGTCKRKAIDVEAKNIFLQLESNRLKKKIIRSEINEAVDLIFFTNLIKDHLTLVVQVNKVPPTTVAMSMRPVVQVETFDIYEDVQTRIKEIKDITSVQISEESTVKTTENNDVNRQNSQNYDWTGNCDTWIKDEIEDSCHMNKVECMEKGAELKEPAKVRPTTQGQTMPKIGKFLEEMANCVVKSEEDAEMALQVSNTLTKALMDYRMRDLSRKFDTSVMKKADENLKKMGDLK
ncbi:hypothetical protein LSH36_764g00022 [Paralvinella palmiformis]|uniref:C2H2-type domain-containing protein n=1 Tax=Paralvinella palmiformis TaxID=53620 RepID=A0AAD9MUA4_9ANNE|nr:hypothetical protein LSH36_764g00022 [Paralvinella palmiformis]